MDTQTKNDVTSLQKLINERAEKKLDNDLKEISRLISGNSILSWQSGNPPLLTYQDKEDNEPAKPVYINNMFMYYSDYRSQHIRSSKFMDAIKAHHLPIYIHRETEAFLQKFDEMTSTVQDLQNQNTEY